MKKFLLPALTALVLLLGMHTIAGAHCEVPCGIYADQQRFEAMLEDTATIKKAMDNVNDLAAKTDGQSANQRTRWVTTKESHATHTQHVIAQYFMTQRLKPAAPDSAEWAAYVDKLTKAHAVMRGAMKCKQTVDMADADALRASILAFHKAYTGKK